MYLMSHELRGGVVATVMQTWVQREMMALGTCGIGYLGDGAQHHERWDATIN